MKGRKLDEVTDAVMTLISRWIDEEQNILNVRQRGPAREIFRQALQDTIERAAK